ncbi:MAG: tRNA (cytidine(34)-2'-O)-methyltransferase [Pseudomonadota bacterium]
MQLALFEPDIPQNTAAILRTAACLAVPVHIIGPAGFDLSPRAVRRAGLDYAATARWTQHADWPSFRADIGNRLVLFTTQGDTLIHRFKFDRDDIIVFGSETGGVPERIHDECAHRVRIPMAPAQRSLNLAVSVGIALSAALSGSGLFDSKDYQ